MVSLLIVSAALLTSGTILYLIRRDLLRLSYSLFWLGIALVVLVLGLDPGINIRLAKALGVDYYPVLPITLAILILFVKTLQQDIELTRKEREIRRLSQEIALLKAKE